jgi:hypothetical protein
VLPSKFKEIKIRGMKTMQIQMKNFNMYTIFSLIILIAGILMYISWGMRYGVWDDIGIYSITIVLVLSGIIGLILSLSREKEPE